MGGRDHKGLNVMFRPISPDTIEGFRPAIAACPHGRYDPRTMNGAGGETGFVQPSLDSSPTASWGRVLCAVCDGHGCRRPTAAYECHADLPCVADRNERIQGHFACEIIYCVY